MIIKCIVCKDEFEAYNKPGHHPHNGLQSYKRPYGCKTCSYACSIKYQIKTKEALKKKR